MYLGKADPLLITDSTQRLPTTDSPVNVDVSAMIHGLGWREKDVIERRAHF
jgi:hypothetical protein